ncbi:MAG: PAS domain-containing protein [Clostridia bacterium]
MEGSPTTLVLYAALAAAVLAIALGIGMHFMRRRAEADAADLRSRARELELEVEEHRRTRATLEAKEQDLQIVTDTMAVSVARCSADFRYLWVNRLYAHTLGLKPDDLVGRPMVDIIGAEAVARMRPHVQEVLKGRRVEYERFAQRPQGRRWIHAALEPTHGADGKPDGWVAVIHDIDDGKRAAEALRDAREQLQIITDTMSAAVCRTGNDLRYAWMNPEYARWLGVPAEQAIGKPVAEMLGPTQMREVAPHIARVLQGEQVHYERLADMPGLGRRWVHVVFTPIVDDAGQVDGWVTICTDIHDRRLAEEALREADRRKDDFLATLAHELRNPLAPIRNAVAILGRKGGLDPELTWSREVIGRQVEQMSRLIDDLLDIERISRGKFLVRKERVSLEQAIDMALEISRPYVTAAGHRLSVLMPNERVLLEADATRLAQVFSNLLNNAAKFTPPRGAISLVADLEENAVVVTVEDNGIGFEPDLGPRLFRPYSQLAAAHGGAQGGLGIGLSLVQGIVGLHGGSVQAQSEGPGKGARFTVRLPRAAVLPAQQQAAPREAAAVPPPGLRVLIADDNKDAADSLARILAHYGYSVKTAYDGFAAIELARTFQPHIAVLDIDMPGKSGYDVAQALRGGAGEKPALVALTGWGQEGDRRRAMEAGFRHHLTKPVEPGTLNELLAEIAGSYAKAG